MKLIIADGSKKVVLLKTSTLLLTAFCTRTAVVKNNDLVQIQIPTEHPINLNAESIFCPLLFTIFIT